jgi:hypothetical protein
MNDETKIVPLVPRQRNYHFNFPFSVKHTDIESELCLSSHSYIGLYIIATQLSFFRSPLLLLLRLVL